MAKPGKRNRDVDDEEISDEEDEDFNGEEDDNGSEDSPRTRKKHKASKFLDVAASEDDEEEDEGDAGGKRRGTKRNRFIDDIAAVDEEEEDEDEEEEVDDLIGDEADEVADQQELQQVYRQVNQRADEDINPEELEKYIKERFERPAYAASDFNEQAGMASQQGLLPTHQDPKLWLVETRTGQEREACIRLMQKSIDLARSGTPLAIKSCFVQDHLQGYMYVEAYKEAHVMEAVRGLRNVLISKGAKLVPLPEMVQAITVNTKAKKVIDVDSWVRMRRFPYQGDAAKVLDVDASAYRALIRFVPRIDYAELGQRQGAVTQNEDGTQKRRPKKTAIRPAAKGFSKQEAERYSLQPYYKSNLGNRVVLPGGGEYEDGYEIKWISMRNISLEENGPSVEELTRYNQVAAAARQQAESELGRDALPDLLGSLAADDTVAFVKGDKVRVTGGDLQGLWGYVQTVRDDGTVEVMPQLKELTEVLPFPPSQLAKTFEVGDHVKVTAGQHTGQTGMVVRAQDRVCTLISDTTRQELNCFAKDLSESIDVSMGLDKFGQYELHDLVVLDQQTTGVIVGVEKDSCRVLTSEGTADNPKIRVCKAPDIKRKFPDSRRITAPDANGNGVGVSDIVTISHGRFQGKTGTARFIVRGSVYLQSKDMSQHGGFICLRSRDVVVKGSKAPGANGAIRIDPSRLLRSPAPHRIAELTSNGGPVLASPMRASGGGFGSTLGRGGGPSFSGRGGGGMRRDPILDRSITIARGPYKGYRGRVVNATDTHVRMELEAQYKTVTVPRTVLPMSDGGVPESAGAARRGGFNAPATPGFNAPRTPGYAAGSRTPMHAWGSRTPMHPGMTPSHPGSATPMHDPAWGAGPTPRHPSMDDSRHDDRYRDMATPYTPADTPGGIAATPGLDSGTPGFGYGNAGTPSIDQRTPGTVDAYSPAFGQAAATPNTGLTPSYADTGLQSGLNRARKYQNVLVSIPGEGGRPGLVQSVDPDGGLLVELGSFVGDQDVSLTSGRTKPLTVKDVVPLRPRKGDKLRILDGNEAGNEGVLTSVAGSEGVVKLADNAIRQQEDVVVVDLASLARLVS